ncbi:MAG: hypothetical protein ACTSSA_10940 [Candidatus Freyarchaeota archaeon]
MFSLVLLVTADINYSLLSIGSALLLVGFMAFGITHLKSRQVSTKPTLCTAIGIMEIITGIVLLGGIISHIMFIAGFASMLITFVLWIPYAWSECKGKKSHQKRSRKGCAKMEIKEKSKQAELVL